MPTYAIGDVQGCYRELQDLLNRVNFDEREDRLWFTGDLVNRGPDSLAVLRLIRSLNAVSVLGNHECHLLAIAAGVIGPGKKDRLDGILHAEDRDILLDWIRTWPLIHFDDPDGYIMLHAGVPPQWDLEQAARLSGEVRAVLASGNSSDFLEDMYGNQPDLWNDGLSGIERLRFIVNAFTRMRYCDIDGRLNFRDKGPPGSQSTGYYPWFELSSRRTIRSKIIFGHWASLLQGSPEDFEKYRVYPLDTGCVWGGKLTAMRLDDGSFHSVPSRQTGTQ
jgi:bis(5'-nucleosyl)-tetraphosphatase (symmetrical)